MRAGLVTLLLVGLGVPGCGKGLKLQPTRLSFDQFVNATVELRQAAAETSNPAEFQLRKREIERKLRFSDADLREFARAHAGDVRVLSAAWDSVEARLNRPATPSKAAPAAPAAGKPAARAVVVPGALRGGLPATVYQDSLIPPTDDTLPPAPPPRNPPKAALNQPKPFY